MQEGNGPTPKRRVLIVDDHPVVRAGLADILSEREREVFGELGRGAAMRSIAQKLFLSVKTVETHVAHIKRKLGVRSAVELRHLAFRAAADLEAG